MSKCSVFRTRKRSASYWTLLRPKYWASDGLAPARSAHRSSATTDTRGMGTPELRVGGRHDTTSRRRPIHRPDSTDRGPPVAEPARGVHLQDTAGPGQGEAYARTDVGVIDRRSDNTSARAREI